MRLKNVIMAGNGLKLFKGNIKWLKYDNSVLFLILPLKLWNKIYNDILQTEM